jgi:pSer/pThr/pTyr-binding forkhead associated (FHA) protein
MAQWPASASCLRDLTMNVTLVGFTKKGVRKEISVQGATVIGRTPDADIQIPVSDVSRRHCEISVKNTGVSVKDLKSSNGTFVNDEKITEKPLKAGDRLRVGPFTFVVQIDGQPKDIRVATVAPVAGAAAPAKKSAAAPPKAVAKAPASDSASDFDLDDIDVDALGNVDLDDMSPIGDLDELEEINPDELEELDSSDLLDEDEGPPPGKK